jgi:glycosyltransferase involved in cell wall biosynthesis
MKKQRMPVPLAGFHHHYPYAETSYNNDALQATVTENPKGYFYMAPDYFTTSFSTSPDTNDASFEELLTWIGKGSFSISCDAILQGVSLSCVFFAYDENQLLKTAACGLPNARHDSFTLPYKTKYIVPMIRVQGTGYFSLSNVSVDLVCESADALRQQERAGFHEDPFNPAPSFILKAKKLKELKMACIMDAFTLLSYGPECKLLELTPDQWKNEIDSFDPDLIFIESAWQGKNGLWYQKISRGSPELYALMNYGKKKAIPIVFWCKEDPIHTDAFLTVAGEADFVFTTDMDCIFEYKSVVRHDRVFHLHFAAQPSVHNPVEKFERKDKFCFAGAYYHRYEKRCNVFDGFAEYFISTKGLDIFDRNYGHTLPEHAFPQNYEPYILGGLKPDEIDRAYKGYHFGINMNSIHQSQTMFARRVFELMASNTIVVGNYSRGVKNYFGDLTICTDSSSAMKSALSKNAADRESMRKYALLGLREVLTHHLYEDRLAYIVEKVFGQDIKTPLPRIAVISAVETKSELDRVIAAFNHQSYQSTFLYLVTDLEATKALERVRIISDGEAANTWIKNLDAEYIAVFSSNDYYGIHYLMDLALTARYYDADGFGKADYYLHDENGNISLICYERRYHAVSELFLRRGMFKTCTKESASLPDILNVQVVTGDYFAIDEFNYCSNYIGEACARVDDLNICDKGIPLKEIEHTVQSIHLKPLVADPMLTIDADKILPAFTENKFISASYTEKKLTVKSALKAEQHKYIYLDDFFLVKDFLIDGELLCILQGSGLLNVFFMVIFYDNAKKQLEHVAKPVNRLMMTKPAWEAKYFRLALRIKGSGQCMIEHFIIGDASLKNQVSCFLLRSNAIILTNLYPSYESLYQHMFIHSRVTAYKQGGRSSDVMCINNQERELFREFEGINLIEGQAQDLTAILNSGGVNVVCVHFLNKEMWNVLKLYIDKIQVIVWVHGSEIQPWWRRKFNIHTDAEMEKAQQASDARMAFWKDMFQFNQDHLHFVFVSQYFANEVMEDYEIQPSRIHYSIIHNCINTQLFSYIPKPVEQRLRIFTIKSFSQLTYANDLTANAIKELSLTPEFRNLEFSIYGDGELFWEVNKDLEKFSNVYLNNIFLTQEKISALHKKHGVYIATTRMDTQGVSRDEAMSSGLVPIANAVAAIPEFVDDSCGILVPGEDYKAVANAILKLYHDPNLFVQLSENAAKRVRRQSSYRFTIEKELERIDKTANKI